MMDEHQGTNDRRLTLFYVLALCAIAVLYRLVPYYLLPPGSYLLWNMAPVGGLALFAGSRLRQRSAILAPVAVMLISDLLLIGPLATNQMTPFSWIGTPLIYGSFAAYALIGRLIRQGELSPMVIGGAALLASLQFFLLTNFAVWLGTLYPHTLAGLMECYLAGAPFYQRTLAGDLFFSGLIFAGHAVLGAAPWWQHVSEPA
jgi:hypothetical protein